MTIIRNSISCLISFVFGLIACNTVSNQTTGAKTAILMDTVAAASVKNEAAGADNEGETIFPSDSLFPGTILTTGTFHEDEVWPGVEKENWYGLFKGKNGFYLQQTEIKTERIYDPILDGNEGEKTGWEVTTKKGDTNHLLIADLPFLQNRKVPSVTLGKDFIYPGDTLGFSFAGSDYKLFATGAMKKDPTDPEAVDVRNYKLYLLSAKEGQQVRQLLVAQPSFEEKMVEVLFAGDIDGDGILDLIIETSAHYNEISPTLYLSRPAGEKEIVKPVARHTSVGC